jgi:hypothetical protein
MDELSEAASMLEPIMEQSARHSSSICLQTTNDLLGKNFLIPAYQRGFRWTEQQVLELLQDVLAFQASDEGRTREGFYCLQPIVVKAVERDTVWEVVDGQQRLTTLFLILQYFNQRLAEKFRRRLYTIDFVTRSASRAYLSEPTVERSTEYIDFHFIYLAKSTIEQWFRDKDNLVNDFEAALLNRVKVIWYELPETENAINAFTRLNVGKIPLTNAELVRALLLRSKNFPDATSLQQLRIAQEWDLIEKALQNDDFWYFLTNDQPGANRIEKIFDLIAQHDMEGKHQSFEELVSFHHFNYLLSEKGERPLDVWDRVKRYFMTLDEWYRDAKLFHLIGFLISEGESVLALIKLSQANSKTGFQKRLKQRIQERFMPGSSGKNRSELESLLREFLEDLEYGTNSAKIKSILLLFNVASIIANSKSIVRFRFDYFKKESWDIEHIRSVKSGRPTANVEKRPWLEAVRDYFAATGENQILRQRAEVMLVSRGYTTGNEFDLLYDDILKCFGENESTEAENGVGNLALLDSGSNRGYKNAVFPIKRRRLLQYDQEGTFVPLCTRNAFLKSYSKGAMEKMFFWSAEDQADYREAMMKTLTDFFCD